MTQFENPIQPAYLDVDLAATSTLRNINSQLTSFYIDDILASPSESSRTPYRHGATSDEELNETEELSHSLTDRSSYTTKAHQSGVAISEGSRKSGENAWSRTSKPSSSSSNFKNPFFSNNLSKNSQVTPTLTSKDHWRIRETKPNFKNIINPLSRTVLQAPLPQHPQQQSNYYLPSEMVDFFRSYNIYDFIPRVSRSCNAQTVPYGSSYYSKAHASFASMLALYPFQNLKYDWLQGKQPHFSKGCSFMWDAVVRRGINRRKGGQVRFSNNQTNVLEKRFVKQKYLSPSERKSIAKDLQLSERQVKTWFQNRRAKWRKLKQDRCNDEKSSENFYNKKQTSVDGNLSPGIGTSTLVPRQENKNDQRENVDITACKNERKKFSVQSDRKQFQTGASCQNNVCSFSTPLSSPKKLEAKVMRQFQTQAYSDSSADILLQKESTKNSFEDLCFAN